MPLVVRYGVDSTAELNLPQGALVAQCGVPQRSGVADLPRALADALAQPLEFPPLRQATVPGDHVVLALEHGVPRASALVCGVVEVLMGAGIDPKDIAVLWTAADVEAGAEDPRTQLPGPARREVKVLAHDPNDTKGLAYLAATEAGHRVFLSRAVVDADVVLPIGCQQSAAAEDYFGLYGTLFPAFSDAATQARFRLGGSPANGRDERRRLAAEVSEVGWLLGVAFAIQVVPGVGDEVLDVVAGEARHVGLRGRELYDAAWRWSVPQRASLVVAAIQGGPVQQTWHNLGRALAAALPLVEPGGAIALCCGLDAPPGPAVQKLVGADRPRKTLERLGADRPADLLPAWQLVRTLERTRVYLLSGLDETTVEDLDMVPLAGPAELARLAGRHESCILVSNATQAVVKVEG